MKKMKLENVIDVFISGDWGKERSSIQTPNKVSCIRGADIDNINAKQSDSIPTRYISKSSFEKKTLKKGDIVIEKSGGSPTQSTGRVAFISEKIKTDLHHIVCSNFCSAFRAKPEYDALFVYYYFQHIYRSDVFFQFESQTTGIKNLLLDSALSEIPFVNFPFLAQTTIARILSSLDDKIELNNKINKELENLAKTIYEYLFVQNANEKWEKVKLSEIANITMGQSPEGNSYNGKGDGIIFYQGCTDFGTRFPIVRQYTTAPTRFAELGDILLSVRAPVGSLNFANTKCCIGRGLAALNSKLGSITHLYFILKDLEIVFNRINNGGTTFGSVTKDYLFTLPITKPPKDILMKFEKIAKPIFDKQFELAKESVELSQIRNFLLPLLMNGEVRVSNTLAIRQHKSKFNEKIKNIINFTKLQELENNHFVKRKMLATYIINQSLNDTKFGNVKFEKLLHLSDYFAIKRNLGQNYYQKAAGPLDNAFTYAYFNQVFKAKWFNQTKKGNQYVFSAGQNHDKSTNMYGYFSIKELNKINEIISYFKNYDYEQPEIVSTLYAVWNNRIIKQQEISDDLLIEDFYNWDEKKKQYERNRLKIALQWMRNKNFIPDGWGKAIEKAKSK